jgi:2-polyprenyl-3-methyl-5-hydroxy-6-metoxy-1,4-benzoquinol methylase
MIIETSDRNQIYYLINRLDRQRQMIKNIKVELSEETDIFKKDIFSLLNNEAWASAVPSYLIFSSAEELKLRASVILDKFFPNVKDKFFLDYGCGDGLVVEEAKRRGAA